MAFYHSESLLWFISLFVVTLSLVAICKNTFLWFLKLPTKMHLGNNFKNVRNWRSICRKNNTPNKISPGFNTLDMFSMYVWHVHNVETLLKLFSAILDRQLRTFFEIIALMRSILLVWNSRVTFAWLRHQRCSLQQKTNVVEKSGWKSEKFKTLLDWTSRRHRTLLFSPSANHLKSRNHYCWECHEIAWERFHIRGVAFTFHWLKTGELV